MTPNTQAAEALRDAAQAVVDAAAATSGEDKA